VKRRKAEGGRWLKVHSLWTMAGGRMGNERRVPSNEWPPAGWRSFIPPPPSSIFSPLPHGE